MCFTLARHSPFPGDCIWMVAALKLRMPYGPRLIFYITLDDGIFTLLILRYVFFSSFLALSSFIFFVFILLLLLLVLMLCKCGVYVCVAFIGVIVFRFLFHFHAQPKSKIVVTASYFIFFCIVSYRKSRENIAYKGAKRWHKFEQKKNTVCSSYFNFITSSGIVQAFMYMRLIVFGWFWFHLQFDPKPVPERENTAATANEASNKQWTADPFASHSIKVLDICATVRFDLRSIPFGPYPFYGGDNAHFPPFSITFHVLYLSPCPFQEEMLISQLFDFWLIYWSKL